MLTDTPVIQRSTKWPPAVKLYIVSFTVVGLSLCMLGPALTDLRERSDTGIGSIGILFAGQSAGYVTGSIIGGRLYDRFIGHRVYACALALLAAGLCLVPLFSNLTGLFLAFVVIGLGAAASDLGANTLLVWQLGAGSDRAMNMLHLFFGVGALLAPLAVYVGLNIAVVTAAVFCLVVAAFALRLPSPTHTLVMREEHTEATRPLLTLLLVFFAVYVGFEGGFGGWITTYGEEVGFSDLSATWLTTVFWIGFTFGRGVASMISERVSPYRILMGASVISIVAALVFLVGDGATAAVWISTVLMGIGTAPQFASMIMLAERKVPLTGSATSWFTAGAGLGGLIFPFLIGRYFAARGASALQIAALVLGSATFAMFLITNAALERSSRHRTR